MVSEDSKKSFGTKADKDPFAIELGSRIKKLRERLGLSQRALAARLGLSNAALAQYEIGARSPGNEVLLQIARGLGTSVDQLLGAADKPEIFVDKEVVEVFEQFSELPPRDRRVVIEIIQTLKKISTDPE